MPAHNPKDSSKAKGTARERRAQRQREAQERQAAADKRTPQEQLRVLSERGVTSGPEHAKLVAMIENGQAHSRAKAK